MTTEENESLGLTVETNTEHYGNNTSTNGVFSEAALPTSPKLEEGLTATDLPINKSLQEET